MRRGKKLPAERNGKREYSSRRRPFKGREGGGAGKRRLKCWEARSLSDADG